MTRYGQYCPIARAAEVLGDRWTLLILREMVCGSHGFNELARGLPRISRGVLAARLRQLERNGLVARADGGYELTEAGAELEPLLMGLGEWAARFGFEDPKPDELDPTLLMWWVAAASISRRCRPAARSSSSDSAARRSGTGSWSNRVTSRCVTAIRGSRAISSSAPTVRTMYRIWLGREELPDALRDGACAGQRRPSELVRRFPGWLELSPLAPAVRAAL